MLSTAKKIWGDAVGNAFIRKLERWTDFSNDDRAFLQELSRTAHDLPRGSYLLRRGDNPSHIPLLLDGWAQRSKILAGGQRQIVAFLLPGDLGDMLMFILTRMDHDILTLSPARVAMVPRRTILDIIETRPTIARALWWSTLVDEATLREWLANIGGRDAYCRAAHLFCELDARMENIGLVQEGRFDLPLTQTELGEALGLSPIHINRVLQRLRADGLIQIGERQLTILDAAKLSRAAGFDPTYLHRRKDGERSDG